MNELEALSWLGRKVGWGFADGQWSQWRELGVPAVIDRLVYPDNHQVKSRPDPFAEIETAGGQARVVRQGIARWADHAVSSPRPLETFMEFFLIDYFGVSIRSIRPQYVMFGYVNLLGRHALGNFADLLREVTVDAAMLGFLDGATNQAVSPNENYARELLELYSVGVGNFDEDDVRSASTALTGWTIEGDSDVQFVPELHDDARQQLLGMRDVHDVATVIDAVLAHHATAPRFVRALATAVLGPEVATARLTKLTQQFAANWELQPLLAGLLKLGVAGAATPSIQSPIGWYATVLRATNARPSDVRRTEFFETIGQIPLTPPNVGGYPPPSAYVSTSATIARFNMASHLAGRSGRNDQLMALTNDLSALAGRLGLIQGFRQNTYAAIENLTPGIDRLAAALASPDMVVV